MEYTIKLNVIISNMHLNNIKNVAEIDVLTNINNTSPKAGEGLFATDPTDHTRIVTDKNLSKDTKSADYVRIKDLIIAGRVWLDLDKNGYMASSMPTISNGASSNILQESLMSGIEVVLYNVTNNRIERITYTDGNGMYTFARNSSGNYFSGEAQRIDKATNKDSNGNYTSSSKFIEYYIGFRYDGVLYKATDVYGGSSSSVNNYGDNNIKNYGVLDTEDEYKIDSNAYEYINDREMFNYTYEYVAYNGLGMSLNSGLTDATYTKEGHNSYLNIDHSRSMEAYTFILKGAYNFLDDIKFLWLYKDKYYTETEYLKYINLGLAEREEVDISLTKDVYKLTTTINGEEFSYEYNQNNGSNLGQYVINNPYNLELYESDFEYRFEQYKNEVIKNYKGKESELNVEVTYKITINNNSIGNNDLNAKIHEIVDLYDENFIKFTGNENQSITVKTTNEEGQLVNKQLKIAEAWYYDNSNSRNNLKLSTESIYRDRKENNFTSDGYNTVYISGMDNLTIEEGEKLDIYVKYILDKDNTRTLKIKDTKPENKGTENIAQVNVYSVWYNNGKATSIVDKDSNPGNIGIDDNGNSVSADNSNYYEDFVYKTGIEITASQDGSADNLNRKIIGKVWDDTRSEATSGTEDAQYFGNGLYLPDDRKHTLAKMNENVSENYKKAENVTEETDIAVRSVKVEIVEIIELRQPDGSSRFYEEKLSNLTWDATQIVRTDENGEYKLSGFIPGYYVVRFTYGDTSGTGKVKNDMLLFNGQDYKSTKYTGQSDDETDYDKILKGLQIVNNSDARDDEIRRLEVISYSETMSNPKAEVLKGLANGTIVIEEVNTTEQLQTLTDNTYMYADTVKFYVKPEKLDKLTVDGLNDLKVKYGVNGDSIKYVDLESIYYDEIKDSDVRKFEIKNLDFGIEYRPESQISLNKEIAKITLKTSNGEELVRLVFKETENFGTTAQQHKIDEDKSTGMEHVQFISNKYDSLDESGMPTEKVQGITFINIDKIILQGSTIEIEYRFIASNYSEIDRIGKNLDNLKNREEAETIEGGNYKPYISYIRLDGDGTLYGKDVVLMSNGKFFYTAAGTAARILKEYEGYEIKELADNSVYSTKEKKAGEYYGKYLGEFYYKGIIDNDKDVVSSLKFDKILDYLDTGLVYKPSASLPGINSLWLQSTDKDLKGLYVKEKFYENVGTPEDPIHRLINLKGVSFVTYQKDNEGNVTDIPITSNLLVSVDDSTVNNELSKYLLPAANDEDNSKGRISLIATKVLSSEDDTIDMEYENIAEVIQFTSQTGRRTNFVTTVGNVDIRNGRYSEDTENPPDKDSPEFEEAKSELDTSATEVITLIPPTGLDKFNRVIRDAVEVTGKGIGIGGIVIAVTFGSFVIIRFIVKKYRKRTIK